MFIIPILIFILGLAIFLALIGGVVYAVIHKKQQGEIGTENTKQIRISEIISNFFSFALLVTNIVSIITILFTVIDVIFKDEISSNRAYNYYNSYSELHSAISLLAIVLPASLILSYWIRKEHIKNTPEMNSPVKKFTIGATMIASLVAVCGSLFSIIYQYLEGDLSSRFIAKVISVFILAAILFVYYRILYTKGQANTTLHQNIFAASASIFIIALSIYAITLTGSPSQIRKEKFDDTRLSDLSSIQQNVLSYWQSHRVLPQDLSQMTDAISRVAIPKDPRSSDSYEYEIITQSTTVNDKTTEAVFKLCAKFETERDTSKKFEELKTKSVAQYDSIGRNELGMYYPMDESPFWNHKAERTCFTRTIDPVVYLPTPPQPVRF